MRLGRALNMEALLDLRGMRQIKAEGGKPGCAGPGGADLQKIAARNLWHPIPQMERLWQATKAQPTHPARELSTEGRVGAVIRWASR